MRIDEPVKEDILNFKSFCVYGLGKTGMSVVNFFKMKNLRNYSTWDDKIFTKNKAKNFCTNLDLVDFIVMSPGISLRKAKLKKKTFRKQR